MLDYLFGFNARLGRLHFFFACIALAVVMTALCFALAGYLFAHTPRGARPQIEFTLPLLILAGLFGVATFMLQSMRLRDIGWDPVIVIPLWVAILIVDWLVATKLPAWSVGRGHTHTVIGALVNLVLTAALMFWPSGDPDTGSGPSAIDTRRLREPPDERARTVAVARVGETGSISGGFGRRGS